MIQNDRQLQITIKADTEQAEQALETARAFVSFDEEVIREFGWAQAWLAEPFHINPLPWFRTRGLAIFWIVILAYAATYGFLP